MPYHLGVDLGTTYTAAAVWREGRVDIAHLGARTPAIPSVLLLRDDGTFLTGETAERRAVTEPLRVAREFKRRMGDPTPLIVGDEPYSAHALMARLLRAVVDQVAEREGGPAASITVAHPANWGPFKLELLQETIGLAGLQEVDVSTVPEPEAAAIHYASQERVEPGAVVAVYDLGGGTFDSAVLRRTTGGWEVLGTPEGVEHLGGIDFDEAVFHHVRAAVGSAFDELDPKDRAAMTAVARLRQECVAAKEALSNDVDVTIPVLLPNRQTEVRLVRSELEGMIRPTLVDSADALRRALRSAGVEPGDVRAVLLVGGSSRVPLVAQVVGSELRRPVAVDAHPKHAVALGAAIVAAERAAGSVLDTLVVPSIEVVQPAPAPMNGPARRRRPRSAGPQAPARSAPPPTLARAARPGRPAPVGAGARQRRGEGELVGVGSGGSGAGVASGSRAPGAPAGVGLAPGGSAAGLPAPVAWPDQRAAVGMAGEPTIVRPLRGVQEQVPVPSPARVGEGGRPWSLTSRRVLWSGAVVLALVVAIGALVVVRSNAGGESGNASSVLSSSVSSSVPPSSVPPPVSSSEPQSSSVPPPVSSSVPRSSVPPSSSVPRPVSSSVSVVASQQGWTDTGIDVEAGDEVRITATGAVVDDINGHPDRTFPPDGVPDLRAEHTGDPFRHINHAALIGRIGDGGEIFAVGADLRTTISQSGRFLLAINDSRFDDNRGTFEVEITVTPASSP